MKLLFENHKNSWSLFIGHLVIEKLLKAVYAKGHKGEPYAPRSHDLLYLAERMKLEIDERHADLLDIITKFNMSARYGDFKKDFQNKCTDEYTSEQIENIEEVRTWLKNLLMTN